MKCSRRQLFKKATFGALAVPLLGYMYRPNPAHARPEAPVPETDPTAAALGYVHDGTKSAERAKKPDGEKQLCSNCILFVGEGKELAGQEGKWGVCNVIQGGLVNADGWCKSWAARPA